MLILTRRAEEAIHIGPDITITVLQIGTRQVSIGIDAPRSVKILRDDAIRTERPAGLALDSGEFVPADELNASARR